MHIGLLVNPKSGLNKALGLAQACDDELHRRGHTTSVLKTTEITTDHDFFTALDRLIIIGGDGTVHHTLPKLIEHQIPFIHLATGTANLIAKEFKMPKEPAKISDWIEWGGQVKIDVPTLNDSPFLIMCVLGMDAGVIHQFENRRKKSGGYRNYFRPVFNEIIRPRPARVRITADDQELTIRAPMNLVIANLRSYALGINPCPKADPTDSKLDLIATPCSTTLGWSLNTILNKFRLPIPTATRLKASTFTIESLSDSPNQQSIIQYDGEIANTPSTPNGVLIPGQPVTIEAGKHQIPVITQPSRSK